ncbi:MAG: SAM-dependent methyltransferase [Myxococcaceae bacterium]|nr:SAM-dependent methyltransferase [Myxococcaceae bacterium]
MNAPISEAPERRRQEIDELAPWFHNLHFADGVQTSPQHFLGDFPSYKWTVLESLLPRDLSGWTALDVGCNAGFYSFELAKRGATVTGIDSEPHYLRQAEWAAREYGLQDRVSFRQLSVYELGRLHSAYDLVLFMGVFYHLRHPLLALDILAAKTIRRMVFQTLTMPGEQVAEVDGDLPLLEREVLRSEGFPQMAFIEQKLAGDMTNWWAPNHAAVLSMLRSSGLRVIEQPGHEIYVCEPAVRNREDDRERAELVRRELAALGMAVG